MKSTLIASLLAAFAALPLSIAQPIVWDGGTSGTGNSLSVVTNWEPDLVTSADLTGQILRISTANLAPDFVPTTSTGMGNILIGNPPAIAGFEFDNSAGLYRLNFGVRLVPTTSTTTTTDRIITFNTAGTIIKAENNAAASIRRFTTNAGAGDDIATVIVNLDYTGSGIIDIDATSSFLFQETKITGTGGLTKTGSGTLTLDSGNFGSSFPNLTINTQYGTSTGDSYSGGLTILAGTVSIDSVSRLPSSTINNDGTTPNPDAVILNGGTLRFSAGTTGSSANRGFRLGSAGGTLEITATNTRIQGSFRNLADDVGFLIKTGPGNLSLEGANYTFSGGTLLQAGTLTLNGITLGDTDGLGITVSAGATLRGHGTINGDCTLSANSTLDVASYTSNAPADPIGTLAFNQNLVVEAANFLYDLDTPSASDLITLGPGAALDIGTGILDLSRFTFTPGSNYAPGVYPLISTSSPIIGTLGSTLTGTLNGETIALSLSPDTTSLLLTVGTPPEGDTTPPIITLNGSAAVSVAWGSAYTDLGATAADDSAPFIATVVTTVTPGGAVNTARPGIYTVTYDATDLANNAADSVVRTVTVSIADATTVGTDGITPLMKYAFGANGPGDTVQAPTLSSTSNTLSITAVVRTNDTSLTITAETNTDLTAPANWTTTGVTETLAADQTALPENCERRVYTVDIGGVPQKFLRLKVTST